MGQKRDKKRQKLNVCFIFIEVKQEIYQEAAELREKTKTQTFKRHIKASFHSLRNETRQTFRFCCRFLYALSGEKLRIKYFTTGHNDVSNRWDFKLFGDTDLDTFSMKN